MRTTLNDRHNFDKEIYNKFDYPKPGTRHGDRNLIAEERERPVTAYDEPAKRKGRMLAKGDFSDKNQGTFALQYDSGEEYRSGIKVYSRYEQDPIKPPEYIPPAQFKRTDRNPILQGEFRREPEPRTRPDQLSNVFGKSGRDDPQEYNERRNYLNEKNKSRVFEEYVPEARTVKGNSYTQAGDLLQYRYGPDYRDQQVPAKPSNNRFDKGEVKQYDDLRNFAEVMKEKRNSSSIFF